MKLNKLMIALVVMLSSFAASAQAQVAKIGDTPYDDVNKAVAAAKDGDTIKLFANVSEPVTVNDKAIFIDTNKRYISIKDNATGAKSSVFVEDLGDIANSNKQTTIELFGGIYYGWRSRILCIWRRRKEGIDGRYRERFSVPLRHSRC